MGAVAAHVHNMPSPPKSFRANCRLSWWVGFLSLGRSPAQAATEVLPPGGRLRSTRNRSSLLSRRQIESHWRSRQAQHRGSASVEHAGLVTGAQRPMRNLLLQFDSTPAGKENSAGIASSASAIDPSMRYARPSRRRRYGSKLAAGFDIALVELTSIAPALRRCGGSGPEPAR